MSSESPVVLVAGAINTDLVATMDRAPTAGETITGTSFAIYGGGKGANQAVSASRSGAKVTLLGAVGADAFGDARRHDLEEDKINLAHVGISTSQASGVALILVEAGGENRIAYVPGATLGVTSQEAIEALADPSISLLLATNELPHTSLLSLFEAASKRGVPVVFNATPDPESCRELLRFVTVLVVNAGEARTIAGTSDGQSYSDLAGALLAHSGVDTVLLTAGEHGAYLSSEAGIIHVPAPQLAVVDTTGAGDTFCGAFAAEFLQSGNAESAVRFAVAASAISVTRAGAQPSIPYRREVLSFLDTTP